MFPRDLAYALVTASVCCALLGPIAHVQAQSAGRVAAGPANDFDARTICRAAGCRYSASSATGRAADGYRAGATAA